MPNLNKLNILQILLGVTLHQWPVIGHTLHQGLPCLVRMHPVYKFCHQMAALWELWELFDKKYVYIYGTFQCTVQREVNSPFQLYHWWLEDSWQTVPVSCTLWTGATGWMGSVASPEGNWDIVRLRKLSFKKPFWWIWQKWEPPPHPPKDSLMHF